MAFGASFVARLPFALPLELVGLDDVFFLAAMRFLPRFVAKNNARSAGMREIGPGPVDDHDDPAAEPDQEIDMQRQPEPPCQQAREFDSGQLRDCGMAADGRECAKVGVVEWFG